MPVRKQYGFARVLDRHAGLTVIAALWFGVLAVPAGAAGAAPAAHLPDRFAIDTLRISLSRQQGNAAYAPQVVEWTAEGGRLEQHGESRTFKSSREQAVGLLNAFLAIHFFEMPDHYAIHPIATLTADGSVLVAKQTSSSASNRACVSVGGYEKCVHYGVQAPAELDRLVARIIGDAARAATAR